MPFVQVDSSAIEAVMVGHYMGGKEGAEYVDLAKRGAHDWLTCKWLGWEFTPENAKRVKAEKGELRERMKRVGHGVNFGMRPWLMHINDPEAFPTYQDAKNTQKFLFDSIPRLGPFQQEIRDRAQAEGYLLNAWGNKHEFYDVRTYDLDDDGNRQIDDITGQWKVKYGKDGNRAIAFLPQSSAGAFMRDSILLLDNSPIDGPLITDVDYVMEHWFELQVAAKAGKTWRRFMPSSLSVHDALKLDVPVSITEYAAYTLLTLMTRKVPELGGLTIGAEAEIGDLNWLEMEGFAKWPMLTNEQPKEAVPVLETSSRGDEWRIAA